MNDEAVRLAIESGAALSAGAAFFALSQAMLTEGPRVRDSGEPLPLLVRILWPLVSLLAPAVGPRVPTLWRQRCIARLRRAELDRPLGPPQWLAFRVACAFVGAVGAAALTSLADLPVILTVCMAATAAFAYPELWLRERIEAHRRTIVRELPVYLDLVTLAVEAGCSLPTAVGMAVAKAPPSPLRRAFERLQRETRAGRSRAQALRDMAELLDTPAVTALVAALLEAEHSGASLGPALRAQAEQRTQERFARAEKLAMEAPVKLLAPLILCIFPCTFIVIGFPIAMRLMAGF
jgi:tight adherence protein C